MKLGKRSACFADKELAKQVLGSIKAAWPAENYPFEIEVLETRDARLEIRVRNNDGIHVSMTARPDEARSSNQSAALAAVLTTVQDAIAEARRTGRGHRREG